MGGGLEVAANKRVAKTQGAARDVLNSPYVKRLLEDPEIRQNLQTAYGSARSAYGRLANGGPPTKVLMENKKLQRELRQTAEALRDVSYALREPPRRRRRGGLGRVLMLGLVAGTLAVVLTPQLRSKVLDLLFGAEEEFDYTSTTAPPAPAPQPVQAG
jgi:hypothetical protein